MKRGIRIASYLDGGCKSHSGQGDFQLITGLGLIELAPFDRLDALHESMGPFVILRSVEELDSMSTLIRCDFLFR